MPRLAQLLAAAAAALASAAGASPVSSGPPSVTCETCQVMALMATRGMAELPPSHHGSRDIGAMDVLEGLCEYSAWGEYAGKAALPTGAMADACERVRDDVEELFEEELVRDGLNEADLRAKACLARGHCDALWGPGEDPDSRESPSERNAREGAAYREEYAARDGVRETVSGLLYRVLREGEAGGARPDVNDHVTVHYRGTLIDGTQFDASYDRGEPAQFGVTGVIPGWTEALMLMTAGAQYELVIPPELAYGPSGSGDEIGPDATLVFTVELLGIDQGAANHGEL